MRQRIRNVLAAAMLIGGFLYTSQSAKADWYSCPEEQWLCTQYTGQFVPTCNQGGCVYFCYLPYGTYYAGLCSM
jgi:hypothetical protein